MIDTSTITHIAHLSRLKLNDAELERYSAQLAAILTYIDTLNRLDLTQTEPTSHVSMGDLANIFRSDEIKPSLAVDEALSTAPERSGDFFRIPKVIEGK